MLIYFIIPLRLVSKWLLFWIYIKCLSYKFICLSASCACAMSAFLTIRFFSVLWRISHVIVENPTHHTQVIPVNIKQLTIFVFTVHVNAFCNLWHGSDIISCLFLITGRDSVPPSSNLSPKVTLPVFIAFLAQNWTQNSQSLCRGGIIYTVA